MWSWWNLNKVCELHPGQFPGCTALPPEETERRVLGIGVSVFLFYNCLWIYSCLKIKSLTKTIHLVSYCSYGAGNWALLTWALQLSISQGCEVSGRTAFFSRSNRSKMCLHVHSVLGNRIWFFVDCWTECLRYLPFWPLHRAAQNRVAGFLRRSKQERARKS